MPCLRSLKDTESHIGHPIPFWRHRSPFPDAPSQLQAAPNSSLGVFHATEKAPFSPKPSSSPQILQGGLSAKPVCGTAPSCGPGTRHLTEPTRWKVQVAAVYLALQRAVAQPERRPSTFPSREVPRESLNNHQWSGLWFTTLLDGKPSLTPCLLQLFPGYKWHLPTLLPPRSSYPPGPHGSWKLVRRRKTSSSIGIKTHTAFCPLCKMNCMSYSQSFTLLSCKLAAPWGSPHAPHPAVKVHT